MNRRDFLLTTSLASAALGLRGHSQAERPNIILMISDDHGRDDLGCYGNPVVQTPNLDRLAAEGIRFTNAFCTTSSCSPSRSVILSGLHNHANGMYGLQHEFHHFSSLDHVASLPVILAAAGYRTARIGKHHLAPDRVYNFERELSAGHANDMASIGRSPVEMAQQCRSFMMETDNRPFFLLYGTDDPHRGLPFRSWPAPNPFGNRPEGYPGIDTIRYDPDDIPVPAHLPDNPYCRAELAEYYQSVSRLDQGIGELLQILKDTAKYGNTVIFYISDNGIAFPGAKTTLYEAGMRLPCIIRTPWQKRRGIEQNAMVSWTDLTPTILEFAGALGQGAEFHGRSFKSILEKPDPQGWDEVYASHSLHEITMYYPMRVVRDRRYKLIWNIDYKSPFPFAWDLIESSTWQSVIRSGQSHYGKRRIEGFIERSEFELYDLENDPFEVNNLAESAASKELLEDGKAKLKAFQARSSDPWYYKWDYK